MLDIELCTGCHACVSACPKECLSMKRDKWGFLRPVINESECISCGLCVKTCEKTKQIPICQSREIWAAKHNDVSVKKESSSGGVFSAISDRILQDGGVIFGARYFDNMSVGHDLAVTAEERNRFRGSKYSYSLCDNSVFIRVKDELKKGKTVMFSGTPCQVAALNTFLGREYENLITVDILCHGISAPVLYEDYINRIQKKKDGIENINYRYSVCGDWHNPKTLITYKSGRRRMGNLENSYFRIFVRDYFLRESCYSCNYARFDRVSDITLGDFWGIENCHNEFDEKDGVSVVIVSSNKGKKLFEAAACDMTLLRCTESDCSHNQLNGLPQKCRNEKFVSDYMNFGYDYVFKKYASTPLSIRVREKLYRFKLIAKIRYLIKGI